MGVGAAGGGPGVDVTVDFDRLVEETLAEGLDETERVHRFRTRVLDAYSGQVPAWETAEYTRALLQLAAPQHRIADLRAAEELAGNVGVARREVRALEIDLSTLETANQQTFEGARLAIEQRRAQNVRVLTSHPRDNNDLPQAFMSVVQDNDRERRLTEAWTAYQERQNQLRGLLSGLKEREAELTTISG